MSRDVALHLGRSAGIFNFHLFLNLKEEMKERNLVVV